ncbi:hypothetical protein CBF23_000895 [Marinomonas agarivorans]|nr:hypothetical protein CBF23_000895 [Marinomonas agarivorans]
MILSTVKLPSSLLSSVSIFCLSFTLVACSSMSSLNTTTVNIKKSQSDKNQYQYLQLENQLKVILVSDPKAEKSAAAMAVNVGANDNPKDQSGLTHFLEHMLFLGTQKYPNASEYNDYINRFGGSNNAYTASDLTNYFFDVQPEGYEGALDRFSQFFIQPLFNEEYTQREKNAVHSEFMAKINNDFRRSNQALKTLFNTNHPANHFSVGNLDTLKDKPNLSLQQQVRSIYEQHYYASNMTLVMVANLPLEKMEEMARVYFSTIKNKSEEKKEENYPLLLDGSQRLQFVEPIKDIHILNLHFIIPSQTSNYQSKPTRYISYLIGQETNNSLYSFLKKKGWITSLTAGLGSEYINQQAFNIQAKLTEKGIKNVDQVINAIFFTIKQIKTSPINPAYIEEEKRLSQLMFSYHGYLHPLELSQTLASQAHKYPIGDILDAFQITRSATAIEIKKTLENINTDNVLIQVISKNHFPNHWGKTAPSWQKEKWYNTNYANLHIKDSWLTRLNQPDFIGEIKFPNENPYIAEELDFVKEFDPTPKSIFQGKGIQFWHRADNRFDQPKSSIYLALHFNNVNNSVRQSLLNKLWAKTMNSDLREDTYLPYNANLNYSLYDTINGINLKTSGYTDKQQKYLLWLVEQVLTRIPEKTQFEQTKTKLIQDLKNTKYAQAYSSVLWSFSHKVIKNSHSIDEMLESINTIEYDDLLCFRKQAIQEFSLTGFSNGNKTHLSSHELAAELADIYESNLGNFDSKQLEKHDLKNHGKYYYKIDTTGEDKAVLYVLSDNQYASPTEQEHTAETTHNSLKHSPLKHSPLKNSSLKNNPFERAALFTLLKQAIGTRFFTELRTEKQLGYIVNTYNLTRIDVPALGFLVQSPTSSVDNIIKEVESFIEKDLMRITQLTDQEFTDLRNTVLQQLKQKEKQLGEDSHRFWKEIIKGSEDFIRKEKAIIAIENTTKEDLINLIKEEILKQSLPRMIITNQKATLPLWPDKLPNKSNSDHNAC